MPRKNGKSALSSGVALYGLLFGPQGGEVYSCAAEKDQAKIVFNMAKRMVELEPDLADAITCYRDVLEVKSTGSIYRALSAEAYSKEGLNPSLVIFDEVHAQPNSELWDVMALASGARVDPLLLGITTAGVMTDSSGGESLCYGFYRHGQDVVQGLTDDPSFCFVWWEPSAGVNADHRSPLVCPQIGRHRRSRGFRVLVAENARERVPHQADERVHC
jgi:phage terminase large subunit-like protein